MIKGIFIKQFFILSILTSVLGCSDDTLNSTNNSDGDSSTDGNSGTCGDGVCDTDETPNTCSTDCSSDWQHISLGDIHTCGIRNGELFCWGGNYHGELGVGIGSNRTIPTHVGNENDWQHISLGDIHTCGIRNGELLCWGNNYYGKLGDGTNVDKDIPVRIGGKINWTHVSLGYHHTCGIHNGELFCWGKNDYGQLGDGTNAADYNDRSTDKKIPTRVGNETDWTHISLGREHTCGIRNNGQLFCWGRSAHGQLGIELYATDKKHSYPCRKLF